MQVVFFLEVGNFNEESPTIHTLSLSDGACVLVNTPANNPPTSNFLTILELPPRWLFVSSAHTKPDLSSPDL